jgi:hypothetical protein
MTMKEELLAEIEENKETKKEEARQRTLAYNRALYAKIGRKRNQSREVRTLQQRKLRNKYKDQLIELLGGCCVDCKSTFPDNRNVYDFHHLDPDIKEGLIPFNSSWRKIVAEAGKCVLLCANCHRIRHTYDTQST